MALTQKRRERKLAIRAKIETDYGTAPASVTAAMQMNDVSLTPLAGEEERRDLIQPYYGNQGAILVGDYVELQGSVEIAGSGAAGTAPAYGPLLRGCSLAEVIVAGTSVTYAPVTDDPESLTIHVNLDGVNHALLGAHGTFTLDFATKKIPRFKFTLRGLFGPVTDEVLPAITLTAFKKPLPISKLNTTLSLFGVAQVAESLAVDLGNTLVTRNLIGEDSIQITDRQAKGTAVVEAKPLATQDWFSIAREGTRGALALQHGTAAGNIVQLTAPALEIGRPTYGASDGIRNVSLPLSFCPVAGNDEFALVIK